MRRQHVPAAQGQQRVVADRIPPVECAPDAGEQDGRRHGHRRCTGGPALDGLWRGEPFAFDGEHYHVAEATFLPPPLQKPRIPVWVGSLRPGPEAPLRRAARWDGFYPASDDAFVPLDVFARDVTRVRALRAAAGIDPEVPYDISAGGSTPADDPAAAAATVAGFAAAGATWWQEIVSDWLGGLDEIRARIDAGPPRG